MMETCQVTLPEEVQMRMLCEDVGRAGSKEARFQVDLNLDKSGWS
jgi:hypothetical protein